MVNIINKILALTFGYFCIASTQPNNIILKIETTKDTIFIGEPLVVKCMLVNKGTKDAKLYAMTYQDLLSYDRLDFFLQVPDKDCEYIYEPYLHVTPVNLAPQFLLQPQDSIYFYALLSWSGYLSGFVCRSDTLYDYLKYDELKQGFYKIKSTYHLPELSLISNTNSFYAVPLPPNEGEIFAKTGYLIDKFFGWPHDVEVGYYQTIIDTFSQYRGTENSVIAQFCHYILAYCVPLLNRVGLNRMSACESFLRKHQNTPLAEQIEFWRAKTFVGIGQEDMAKEVFHRAHMKYPDNIIGYLYQNKKQKEPIFISAGLIIVDEASLKAELDSTAKVVKKLAFGEPFLILEVKPLMEEGRECDWYKVMLPDKKTIGWISGTEGRGGSIRVVDLEKNDFAGLYYLIAGSLAWGHNEYEIAEKLLHYALETYGNRKMLLIEPITGGIEHVHANMAILKRLAMFYGHEKEFNKSIQYYAKRLAQKEATKEDTVVTKYGMMRVYFESIKETKATDEAMRFYHHIIRDFPNETFSWYEGWVWLDIKVAEYIVETFAVTIKDTNKLQQECQKIIDETINPAVFLIAKQALVMALTHAGNYELAKAALLDAVSKYPKEIKYYWKDHKNYTSTFIAQSIWVIYNKYKDYKMLHELIKSIKENISDDYDIIVDEEHDWLTLQYIASREMGDEPSMNIYKYSLWHGGLLKRDFEYIHE